ncbi:MAG: hypothetical protein Q8O61_09110 [Nocardioides sp.]|nr:hypothetical protein [Nocardioides sp.]
MKVKDPSGQTWRVTRRWVPWRRRLKGFLSNMPTGPGLGDDPVSLVIGVIFLVIMIPFFILALVAALELLLLLLLLLVIPFVIVGIRHGDVPRQNVGAIDPA